MIGCGMHAVITASLMIREFPKIKVPPLSSCDHSQISSTSGCVFYHFNEIIISPRSNGLGMYEHGI